MARPQKKGVDYFPHNISHGKTLFVLEQRWGNDGYAVWFKLLEALGSEQGHYLDLRDEATELHLAAKCRIEPEKLRDILGTLAALGAISTELWRVSSVVWSQNFVDGVAEAYRLRKGSLPKAPFHLLPQEVSTEEKRVSTEEKRVSPVSTEETPQRRGEESILKEKPLAAASTTTEESRHYPPEPMPQASGGEFLTFKEISNLYLNTFPVVSVVPMVQQTLQQWRKDYPRGIIEEAFTRAARANAKTLGYVEKILKEGLREDITTDDDYVPFTEKYANGGK